MLTLYQLKPTFQQGLRPLLATLARSGILPNHLTLAALGLSIATGAVLVLWPSVGLWLLPPVLLVRMALNALDGMLAREYQLVTPWGGILNELGDVVADTALYLPLALLPGIFAPGIVAIVIGALLTEFAGVLGPQRSYAGPMGKSDRALLFGIMAILLSFGLVPTTWFALLWPIICCLEIWTIGNRLRAILAEAPCS
jgi:CDP-diacylglycerol---glycerol-3-phosphate 3-phosphatidyltransferase